MRTTIVRPERVDVPVNESNLSFTAFGESIHGETTCIRSRRHLGRSQVRLESIVVLAGGVAVGCFAASLLSADLGVVLLQREREVPEFALFQLVELLQTRVVERDKGGL